MSGPRAIIHVDMDAFFASVEQRDQPELRDRPVLVGGAGQRGVVAAASYEARRFGVYSAMPMSIALRKCPQAIVVPPQMERYAAVSAQVFAIFKRFTPLVEGLSLDEAFLDVTGSQALFGSARDIARSIKGAITEELSLTASAGIAPNKFVAKIASEMRKPNGLFEVEGDVAAFLSPLPVERMWGVGKKSADLLHAASIRTIGDLSTTPEHTLQRLLGRSASHIRELSLGIDWREVVVDRESKSIGSESTFDRDLHTKADVEQALLAHSARVASRLTKQDLRAQVVRVKLRYGDFELITRQKKLTRPAGDTDTFFAVARALLTDFPRRGKGVRLVGVAGADLVQPERQQELFETPARDGRRDRLEEVRVGLEARFGKAGITRAALLPGRRPQEPDEDPGS